MARVVQHALGGERVVPLERFLCALGERLAPCDASGAARPPLVARWLIAGATRVVRVVLAREFRGRRAVDGQGEVLADAVECFACEQLLGLALDRVRTQVHAAHLVLVGAVAVAVLGPLIYLVAGG